MAEDRKFKFEDGKFINRVSGKAIPDDEPVIIFRARDRHAVAVLNFYWQLATDEHHREAISDRIEEFLAYKNAHPEQMKEPGITRAIRLNRDIPAQAIEARSATTTKIGVVEDESAVPQECARKVVP